MYILRVEQSSKLVMHSSVQVLSHRVHYKSGAVVKYFSQREREVSFPVFVAIELIKTTIVKDSTTIHNLMKSLLSFYNNYFKKNIFFCIIL